MRKFYVAWKEPDDKKWYVVGALKYDGEIYTFTYTRSSETIKNFKRFAPFEKNTTKSNELFPFFQNRILNSSRPEYMDLLKWMDMENQCPNQLDILAMTEGKRGTDTIEVFSCPEPKYGKVLVRFFSHGIAHTHIANQDAVNLVSAPSKLYLMFDFQNQYDNNAISIRSEDPACLLGYIPRYLAPDIRKFFDSQSNISAMLLKVNPQAPLSYRFLCQIESDCPKDFEPCSGEEFQLFDE